VKDATMKDVRSSSAVEAKIQGRSFEKRAKKRASVFDPKIRIISTLDHVELTQRQVLLCSSKEVQSVSDQIPPP